MVTTPLTKTDPHFFEQVNHSGTAEVVYAAEDTRISKFIHLSSKAVCGTGTTLVNKSTPTNLQTHYGISKLRLEEHVNRLMGKVMLSYLVEGMFMDSVKACVLMRLLINLSIMPISKIEFKYLEMGNRPEHLFKLITWFGP